MKKLITLTIAAAMLVSVTGCGNDAEIEALKQENQRLEEKLNELSNPTYSPAPVETAKATAPTVESTSDIKAEWVQDGTTNLLESDDAKMEVKDTVSVAESRGKYVVIMNFVYTSYSNEARNFINDSKLDVIAYQNGIELDRPGYTSDGDIYNTGSAYSKIKNGATIEAQQVFVLQDLDTPVEVELGHFSDYSKKVIKTINITH